MLKATIIVILCIIVIILSCYGLKEIYKYLKNKKY